MDTEHELPRYPSLQEVADYLNVGPATVRRMITDGELRAMRVGRRLLRIDRDSVLELMK